MKVNPHDKSHRKSKTKAVNIPIRRGDEDVLKYRHYNPKYNYMKYWRIVKYWVKRKWNINQADLEVLLFLYDEGIFTTREFRNFTSLLSWDKDRLQKYVKRDLVVIWREPKGYQRLYTLSQTAKRICSSVYKKLLQEEIIPIDRQNNPIFVKSNSNSTDKIYRRLIKEMNAKK